jgi:hypothetical protein
MPSKESVKDSQKERQWPQSTGKFLQKDKRLKIVIQSPEHTDKVQAAEEVVAAVVAVEVAAATEEDEVSLFYANN